MVQGRGSIGGKEVAEFVGVVLYSVDLEHDYRCTYTALSDNCIILI
jgi:hypothetical protein